MASLNKIMLIGFPGQNFVQDTALEGAYIITVTRNGMGHDKVNATPGNRQCQHETATGKIFFSDVFVHNAEPGEGHGGAGGGLQLVQLETANITYR